MTHRGMGPIGFLKRKRRSKRQNLSALKALVAAPHDLDSGALVMPAGARLAISHSVGLSAGQVTIAVGDRREFTCPALAADEVHRGIHAERGFAVTQTGAPAGTIRIYLVDPLDGTHARIAFQAVP